MLQLSGFLVKLRLGDVVMRLPRIPVLISFIPFANVTISFRNASCCHISSVGHDVFAVVSDSTATDGNIDVTATFREESLGAESFFCIVIPTHLSISRCWLIIGYRIKQSIAHGA